MDNQTKKCSKCGEKKLLVEFYKNSQKIGGYGSQCKLCTLEYQKRYRRSPEGIKKIAAYKKLYTESGRGAKRSREYRAKNLDKIRKRERDRYHRLSDEEKKTRSVKNYKKYKNRRLQKCKEYYANNSDIVKERVKSYRENPLNKNKIKARKVIDKKKQIEKLTDGYIRSLILRTHGLKAKNVTIGLIKLKRELIIFHRLKRRLEGGINSTRDQRT